MKKLRFLCTDRNRKGQITGEIERDGIAKYGGQILINPSQRGITLLMGHFTMKHTFEVRYEKKVFICIVIWSPRLFCFGDHFSIRCRCLAGVSLDLYFWRQPMASFN